MFRASLVAHSESCLLCGHNLLINEQINDVSFIIRDKENVWLKAACFRLNTKRLLCFHVQLSAVQKPLATILHFQITLTFFYSVLFWGVRGGSHQEIPRSPESKEGKYGFQLIIFLLLSWNLIILPKHFLILEMQTGCHCLPPRGDSCATELRNFNWPVLNLQPLYLSIFMRESMLADSCDCCYADRNVNRVPGGAGMWAWVKRTHASTVHWPADIVIWILILLSALKLHCCSQCQSTLGGISIAELIKMLIVFRYLLYPLASGTVVEIDNVSLLGWDEKISSNYSLYCHEISFTFTFPWEGILLALVSLSLSCMNVWLIDIKYVMHTSVTSIGDELCFSVLAFTAWLRNSFTGGNTF